MHPQIIIMWKNNKKFSDIQNLWNYTTTAIPYLKKINWIYSLADQNMKQI